MRHAWAIMAALSLISACTSQHPPSVSGLEIRQIVSISPAGPEIFEMETNDGDTLLVHASRASVVQDMLHGDAFSQDYFCSFTPKTDGTSALVGCNGGGAAAPTKEAP